MNNFFMQQAIEQAKIAYSIGEIPIGAIVVKDNTIIGRGHNLREASKDPTSHAEIMAIKRAACHLGGWRLTNCDLYVTIEPCPMCAGAIMLSRIRHVYIGAMDKKGGAVGSLYNILKDDRLNHTCDITYGVLEKECSSIMKSFFRDLRLKKKS